jgi:hypothetical protein
MAWLRTTISFAMLLRYADKNRVVQGIDGRRIRYTATSVHTEVKSA